VTGAAPWHIRPAAATDLLAVDTIERSSFDDPWPRRALLVELQPDQMRRPLIAELAGEVVGYFMAWRIIDQLHVLNLAVAESCRRRGAGSALLAAGLAAAQADGLQEATLEVRPSNAPALQFYRRHGFVPVGKRLRYYADTGEDAIIMTLPLTGSGT
jgi:ribosomal-protein-alanine N-acetyltransferase